MQPQEREAFRRMAEEMPDDERLAFLAAYDDAKVVDGQVDLIAVTEDAMRRLGMMPEEIEQTFRAVLADPPDWRRKLT